MHPGMVSQAVTHGDLPSHWPPDIIISDQIILKTNLTNSIETIFAGRAKT